MLLVMMTLLGTFYPAIDLAAGEKERGTLETLLTAPVPPGQIVAGKFLTVTVVGLLSAALNLGSMLLTFQTGLFQLGQAVNIRFSLPFSSVLVIFGTLFPLAVFFGALFLGVAVRSQSFKEAQNALTPVYILVLLPALLPLFPGIEATPVLLAVPVASVSLLFRELMAGTATLFMGSLALLSTLAYASAALVFAAVSFGREEVLFGEGGDSGEKQEGRVFFRGLAHATPIAGDPDPKATFGLIAGVAVVYFYLGSRLMVGMGENGLMVAELGLLLLPALLFLRLGGYDPKRALSLRTPGTRQLVAAVLIIAGGTPLVWLLSWLQSFVLPMPWEFLEGMSEFLTAETPGQILWLLVLVAVTPAICEEALFRGVFLAGTRAHTSTFKVILLNGIVFGAFHIPTATVFRLLPSTVLGMLLAWVVLRTRSIWPAVLMHLLNNGSIVLLTTVPWFLERFPDPTQGPPVWLLSMAVLSLAAGGFLLERGGRGGEGGDA
jgi:sodium transport system permease protein